MKEIGGFIEWPYYDRPMLHEEAIALNSGRNCLNYIIIARKNIKRIHIPYFLCGSVKSACKTYGVETIYYHVDNSFMPVDLDLGADDWLYLVNYYGQLTNETIEKLWNNYPNLIVDNAHAYYQKPIPHLDTLYTCRKFLGVPDGAFLYTDSIFNKELKTAESFQNIGHLVGRFERTASEFYANYRESEKYIASQPLMRMSKLTANILHSIDYECAKSKRTKNYMYLNDALSEYNLINVQNIEGAYAYPLYVRNGNGLRKHLIENKIYIPVLWPNVLEEMESRDLEYMLASNILPLPVDERYGPAEMNCIIQAVLDFGAREGLN